MKLPKGWKIEFAWAENERYKNMAECDYEKKVIRINLELFIAASVYHEVRHARNRKLTEKQVERAERDWIRKSSKAEIRRLARQIIKKGGGTDV